LSVSLIGISIDTKGNKEATLILKKIETRLNETSKEEEPLDLNVAQEEKGFFPGITGAVVGALGPAGTIGVLIFIIVIVAILIFVIMRKKRNKSYQ